MDEAIRQLSQQVLDLNARLVASEAAVTEQRSAAAARDQQLLGALSGLQALPQVLAGMATATSVLAERSKPSLIDTRGLGRPQTFDNKEESFQRWATKLEGFVGAVYDRASDVLSWAVEQTVPISKAALLEEFGTESEDPVDNLEMMNQQLFTALQQLTEGESQDIVQKSNKVGVEAWRQLYRRFDPATGGRKRNLLRAIISPGRSKLEDLQASLSKWEILVQRYEHKIKKEMDDELKLAGLEALVPAELEQHLLMNAARLDTYALARTEIVTYVESKTGLKIRDGAPAESSKSRDPNAMDCGSFTKGGGGKGGGEDRTCFNCGKAGHIAKDCWSPAAGGKGKPKGKADKGKADKGKGKSKGKADKGKGKKGKGQANSLGEGETTGGAPAGSAGTQEEPGWAAEDWSGESWEEPVWGQTAWDDQAWVSDAWQQAVNAVTLGSLELVSDKCEAALCAVAASADWVRVNLDTGAGLTVFEKRMAKAGASSNGNSYKTASGEFIEDYGPCELAGEDEHGVLRSLPGRCSDVHKTLASASKIAVNGRMDHYLGFDGGYCVPRDSPVGRGLRAALESLVQKHGMKGLIPVYLEDGVYNFYLRVKPEEAAAVQGNGERPVS